ncbi:MAG TPA: hypothetical protein PKA63_14005 [Oligoflexia bacterium]|nr:hypothetical protein [Oligoflexia bacterium]HMP49777.1 hypothetical protein [Oligoflexia bacterium]
MRVYFSYLAAISGLLISPCINCFCCIEAHASVISAVSNPLISENCHINHTGNNLFFNNLSLTDDSFTFPKNTSDDCCSDCELFLNLPDKRAVLLDNISGKLSLTPHSSDSSKSKFKNSTFKFSDVIFTEPSLNHFPFITFKILSPDSFNQIFTKSGDTNLIRGPPVIRL